jgi:hypothetical protein
MLYATGMTAVDMHKVLPRNALPCVPCWRPVRARTHAHVHARPVSRRNTPPAPDVHTSQRCSREPLTPTAALLWRRPRSA